MRSNAARALLGAALLIAAVVLFLVLKDDGDNGAEADGAGNGAATRPKDGSDGRRKPPPQAATIPTIEVRNGKPVGGALSLTFREGDRIRFTVTSDRADEVHVHGYDIEREVGPGQAATFDFPASIEGLFEAELHGSEEQIAELRIEP